MQAADDFTVLGGSTIKGGTLGTVTKCFDTAGELGYSYDVTFENFGKTWCFEADLAPAPDITPPPAAPMAVSKPSDPPSEDDVPPSLAERTETDPTPDHKHDSATEEDDGGEPAIRVMKPEALPDHLQTAVEVARGKAVTVTAPTVQRNSHAHPAGLRW